MFLVPNFCLQKHWCVRNYRFVRWCNRCTGGLSLTRQMDAQIWTQNPDTDIIFGGLLIQIQFESSIERPDGPYTTCINNTVQLLNYVGHTSTSNSKKRIEEINHFISCLEEGDIAYFNCSKEKNYIRTFATVNRMSTVKTLLKYENFISYINFYIITINLINQS